MKANQAQRPNYEHIGLEMKAQFMTSLAASFTRWRRICYLCSKKMTSRITEKFVILNTFMHTLNYIIFSIRPSQLREPRVVILNTIYNHFTVTNPNRNFFFREECRYVVQFNSSAGMTNRSVKCKKNSSRVNSHCIKMWTVLFWLIDNIIQSS